MKRVDCRSTEEGSIPFTGAMNEKRRYDKINAGGRVFLPRKRMNQIRWEESVVNSAMKRQGITDPVIRHRNCGCGSIECLAVPTGYNPKTCPPYFDRY